MRLAAIIAGALMVAACGSGSSEQVLVSAAASLTGAFTDMEEAFEAAHPGVDVMMNFGGSSALREQILGGAPVDVFAAADEVNMERVAASGEVAGTATVFALNEMQIAVPGGNPAGVTGLNDFADPGLLAGLCAAPVPCGSFARRVLEKAGVVPSIDTDEPDARALLTKIEAGELDAGIVYVTDVLAAAGRVDGIEIPPEVNVAARYPIAVLVSAPNPQGAEAFAGFVSSDEGRSILAAHGFGVP